MERVSKKNVGESATGANQATCESLWNIFPHSALAFDTDATAACAAIALMPASGVPKGLPTPVGEMLCKYTRYGGTTECVALTDAP